MTFCTAHRPDRHTTPKPAPYPFTTAAKTERRQRPLAPGQIFTDWASI